MSHPPPERLTAGPRTLVFDVNESLLDLAPLERPFAEAYGGPDAMKTWFSTLLQFTNIATFTEDYRPFGELGLAAADVMTRQLGVTVGPETRMSLVDMMLSLPPHPEVKDALTTLRSAGFRLVALTNSAPSAAQAQLTFAELRSFFDRVYTADPVRVFKPHRRVYEAVAADLGVATSDLRMIAAHGWDIAGAMAAGCAGAFIARPGKELYPLAPRPDVIGPDLQAVAGLIVTLEQPA